MAWILYIMIYTAHRGVILVPYQEYDNRQICEIWKGQESVELGVPMTCGQERGA
jgi:hypothetical protein